MALTAARHAELVLIAGPDYTYPGVRGSSRPGSDVRTELRADLVERQGNLCPVCGDALRFAQFNHVVSRGNKVKGGLGHMPENLFAGCATCNLDCALRFGEVTEDGMVKDGGVIPFEHFARPDLIPSEWTPFPILRDRRAANRP
jgi:hypothetical protein